MATTYGPYNASNPNQFEYSKEEIDNFARYGSFTKPATQTKGKVLGVSTSAPTVKRYTAPATSAPTSKPGPVMPQTPNPVLDALNNPNWDALNPVSAPPQTPDYKNPIDEYYEGLDRTAPGLDETASIREQARRDMQAYLDAINSEYAGMISREQLAGEGRLGQTRAINARSGLIGSDFGESNTAETKRYNEQNVKAIEAEKATRIAELSGKIDQRARDEIAARKAEALGNSEKYIKRLESNQEAARTDLKAMAKAGVQLDPTKKAVLQKQTGYDPLTFESIYAANQPVPEYFSPIETKNGELIMVAKDGSTKNLGRYDLPSDYTLTFQPGTGIPFIYDKNTGEFKAATEYHRPENTTPKDTRTASQKEYEYSKSQGFKGTFIDYQKEIKNLTKTDDLSFLENL